jgi:hypothetical protein
MRIKSKDFLNTDYADFGVSDSTELAEVSVER